MPAHQPLLLRGASLVDGRVDQDILVQAGRVAAIGPGLAAPADAQVLDAGGWLLAPPFVDPHFHMDATLSYGLPRVTPAARCSKASRCGAS